MAILDNIKNIFTNKPEVKNSNMMGYFGVGTEENKQYKYDDLAKELSLIHI